MVNNEDLKEFFRIEIEKVITEFVGKTISKLLQMCETKHSTLEMIAYTEGMLGQFTTLNAEDISNMENEAEAEFLRIDEIKFVGICVDILKNKEIVSFGGLQSGFYGKVWYDKLVELGFQLDEENIFALTEKNVTSFSRKIF